DNPLRQAVIYSDSQAAIRAVTDQCKLESTSVKAKFREEEEWRWRKARQLTYIKKTGVMLDRRQCRRLRVVAVSMNDRRLISEALTGHGCVRAHLSRLDGLRQRLSPQLYPYTGYHPPGRKGAAQEEEEEEEEEEQNDIRDYHINRDNLSNRTVAAQ
ncbi:hypothetical protein FOZ61_001733, partial [Perkinsus olseni]